VAKRQELLEDLEALGPDPGRRCLFVIGGSQALRTAINVVFRGQARRLADWSRLEAGCRGGDGPAREVGPVGRTGTSGCAASSREGMQECFTISRLDVPPSLHCCLASTDLVESEADSQLVLGQDCTLAFE
jgi:hypothetical protein